MKSTPLFLLFVALLIGGFVFLNKSQDSVQKSVTNYSEERSMFVEHINMVGPEEALLMFKRSYENEHFATQHNMAHIFGEALHEVFGTDGVVHCDGSFQFGCFHGFFGVSIALNGLTILEMLDAACLSAGAQEPSACQHGIGHGILEYIGYDHLVDALELCERTNQPNPVAGCTSGVFMEYNVPLSENEYGEFVVTPRPLDETNPLTPCSDVPERFRESCYHELPQWWNQVYDQDYKRIAGFCSSLTVLAERRACILGVGNIIAPTSDYTVEQSVSWCNEMHRADDVHLCIASASWSFAADEYGRKNAHKLCKHIPNDWDIYSCATEVEQAKKL